MLRKTNYCLMILASLFVCICPGLVYGDPISFMSKDGKIYGDIAFQVFSVKASPGDCPDCDCPILEGAIGKWDYTLTVTNNTIYNVDMAIRFKAGIVEHSSGTFLDHGWAVPGNTKDWTHSGSDGDTLIFAGGVYLGAGKYKAFLDEGLKYKEGGGGEWKWFDYGHTVHDPFEITCVSEPATIFLIGSGLIILAGFGRQFIRS